LQVLLPNFHKNFDVLAENESSQPLTRRYVEQDLRQIYKGDLYYANDAFDGLRYMEQIASRRNGKRSIEPVPAGVTPKTIEEDENLIGLEAKIAMVPKVTQPVSKTVASIDIPTPPFWGTKVVENIPLEEVFCYINEAALIRGQWQMRRGKLTETEYKKMLDEKVYPDFQRLKTRVRRERLLEPKVAYGYFPCQSNGDDLIIYKLKYLSDPVSLWNYIGHPTIDDLTEWIRFTFPRQTKGRFLCISDFFASKDSGKVDVVAFHLVTMGKVASEHSAKLFKSNNYKEYLYFHGLSVESAEALAELWYKKIREELGIHLKDASEIKKLFNQHYQGSRYSFGYPACPSLEDQAKLFELLQPEQIGVSLTEEYQLVPEQSTSAIIVHHPEVRYFNI